MLPLIAAAAVRSSLGVEEWRVALRAEAWRQAVIDVRREAELRRLLAALADAGARALLMKGAHLAYTHYERPDLRPRIDTDIMIARDDREMVFNVLDRLGYTGTGHVAGTLVMYQACYVKGPSEAPVQVLDVHWKVANPQVFADLISYEELRAAAVPIPSLGPGAWGLGTIHALLIACVHRVAHHRDADRLIWLNDIQLLASRLSAAEWIAFDALSEARGVRQVCARSLDRTTAVFGDAWPLRPREQSHTRLMPEESATAAFLKPNRRYVEVVLGDLRALPSWRDRVRLLGQHVFPPAVYMRHRYAPTSSAPLPVLYLRRALHGAWKWLARS